MYSYTLTVIVTKVATAMHLVFTLPHCVAVVFSLLGRFVLFDFYFTQRRTTLIFFSFFLAFFSTQSRYPDELRML